MAPAPWLALLGLLPLAGCLQASVAPLDPEGAPVPTTLVLQADEREDLLLVTAASGGFEWSTFGMSADQAGTQASAVGPGGDSEGARVALGPGEPRTLSASPELVMAGDFLRLCSGSAGQGPVAFTVTDLETGATVATATLESVAPCA